MKKIVAILWSIALLQSPEAISAAAAGASAEFVSIRSLDNNRYDFNIQGETISQVKEMLKPQISKNKGGLDPSLFEVKIIHGGRFVPDDATASSENLNNYTRLVLSDSGNGEIPMGKKLGNLGGLFYVKNLLSKRHHGKKKQFDLSRFSHLTWGDNEGIVEQVKKEIEDYTGKNLDGVEIAFYNPEADRDNKITPSEALRRIAIKGEIEASLEDRTGNAIDFNDL